MAHTPFPLRELANEVVIKKHPDVSLIRVLPEDLWRYAVKYKAACKSFAWRKLHSDIRERGRLVPVYVLAPDDKYETHWMRVSPEICRWVQGALHHGSTVWVEANTINMGVWYLDDSNLNICNVGCETDLLLHSALKRKRCKGYLRCISLG